MACAMNSSCMRRGDSVWCFSAQSKRCSSGRASGCGMWNCSPAHRDRGRSPAFAWDWPRSKGWPKLRASPPWVSNLEALAEFGHTDARATIIDARRGEVYAALYDGAGNQIVPEMVGPLERFLALLPPREIEWIHQLDSLDVAGRRAESWLRRERWRALLRASPSGARLSVWPLDPAAIDANYVRRSDAEILWKET